jgi:uncharacterized cupin superfamily protein
MNILSAKVNEGSSVQLADFPIPSEQILEGEPAARIWIAAQSSDLKVTQGVWDCTAGKFSWDYIWDEFVVVLEGEVTIAEEGGQRYTLRASDFVRLPFGLKTTWHVPKYVKKTFILRTPEPLEL